MGNIAGDQHFSWVFHTLLGTFDWSRFVNKSKSSISKNTHLNSAIDTIHYYYND